MREAGKAALATAATWTAPWRVLPDYLIAGAKRCGTTSLQAALARHPCVVPPHSGKGTHFFDQNYGKGEAWFRGHYPTRLTMRARSARAGAPVITGEASPYYAFHPAGFERIARHLPGARLLFVLRDPADRAYSHWRYERRRGFETLGFHEALDLEEQRLAGEEEKLLADPTYASWEHRHYSYLARGRYADQLDRCYRLFARDQVLLVRFDDLVGRGSATFAEVCRFLGLPPEADRQLPRLESGGESALPADVQDRLRAVFAEPNARLRDEHGIDFG
jgi:hypothetical protein